MHQVCESGFVRFVRLRSPMPRLLRATAPLLLLACFLEPGENTLVVQGVVLSDSGAPIAAATVELIYRAPISSWSEITRLGASNTGSAGRFTSCPDLRECTTPATAIRSSSMWAPRAMPSCIRKGFAAVPTAAAPRNDRGGPDPPVDGRRVLCRGRGALRHHSARSAMAGSARLARCAGIHDAARTVSPRIATAAAKLTGSAAGTP